MKRILTILALIALSAPAMAAHQTAIEIKVNGMVCDFCAQSVWKVFKENEGVEAVDVNLDTGTVTVTLEPGADLSDETVNKNITYAGYDLVSVVRKNTGHE